MKYSSLCNIVLSSFPPSNPHHLHEKIQEMGSEWIGDGRKGTHEKENDRKMMEMERGRERDAEMTVTRRK